MILGLDISTSCTGVTILDYTGTVVLNTCWKFKEEDSFDEMVKYYSAQNLKCAYTVDEKSTLANAFGAGRTPQCRHPWVPRCGGGTVQSATPGK